MEKIKLNNHKGKNPKLTGTPGFCYSLALPIKLIQCFVHQNILVQCLLELPPPLLSLLLFVILLLVAISSFTQTHNYARSFRGTETEDVYPK